MTRQGRMFLHAHINKINNNIDIGYSLDQNGYCDCRQVVFALSVNCSQKMTSLHQLPLVPRDPLLNPV